MSAKKLSTKNSPSSQNNDDPFAGLGDMDLDFLDALDLIPTTTQNPTQETLTVKSFFVQRVNQVLFGKKDPNEDEKYASVSQRVSSATGISFDLKRRKNKEFHLKIGKFSIDRKRS
jgi:hypothetical protein